MIVFVLVLTFVTNSVVCLQGNVTGTSVSILETVTLVTQNVFDFNLQWCHIECVQQVTNQTSALCFSAGNEAINNNCDLSPLATEYNSSDSALYCYDNRCPVYYDIGPWFMFLPWRIKDTFSLESTTSNETFLVGNETNRHNADLRCALESDGTHDFFVIDGSYLHCLGNNNLPEYIRPRDNEFNRKFELYTFKQSFLNDWTSWLSWSSCDAACGTGSQERWRYCFPDVNGVQNCTETNSFDNRTCNTEECPWKNGTTYKHLGCRSRYNYEYLFTEEMESKHKLLDSPAEERLFPIEKCAIVTLNFSRTIFALSSYACLNSVNETYTYDTYLNATSTYDCQWNSENAFDIYTLNNDIVEGQWGPWSSGGCNQDCGGGNSTQTRLCDNPPVFDGVNCTGISEVVVSCNEHLCPTTTEMTTEDPSPSVLDSINYLESLVVGVDRLWSEEDVNEYIDDVTSEASQIIDLDNAAEWQQADDSEVIHLIDIMEKFALDLLTVGNSFHIVKKNLDMYVSSHIVNSDLAESGLTVNQLVSLSPTNFQNLETSVDSELGVATLQFNNIDMWIKPTSNITESGDSNFTLIDSKLLSIATYPQLTDMFTDVDIELKLVKLHNETYEEKKMELLCSFLDINQTKSSEHLWSQRGCHLINSDVLYILCKCNHLTTFGVLMRVTDVPIDPIHEEILSWITTVCCYLSLTCLLAAFVVFVLFRNLLGDQFIIHKNLIASLFCAQLLYVTGIGATNNEIVCKVIAISLHFFYTVSFCWMLIEGVNLYFKLVKVFNNNNRFPYYYIIGWGMPIILVGTSLGIAYDGYGTAEYCWLSTDIRWFFVGPVLVVIVINTGILILVIKIIIQSSINLPKVKNKDGSPKFSSIRSGIKGSVILLPILGATWIFGTLSLNSDLLVFEYMFAVLNSLQGVFIFLFYCALNSDVRGAFKLKWTQKISNSISPGMSNVRDDHRLASLILSGNRYKKSTASTTRPTPPRPAPPCKAVSMHVEDLEGEIKDHKELVTSSDVNLNQSQSTLENKPKHNNSENPFKKKPVLYHKKPSWRI